MDRKTIGALTGLIAVATLPAGILAALFLGLVPSLAVFVVGWLLLVPAVPILGELLVGDRDDEATDVGEDPIEEVKRAYARGEIDEAELERRTGVILETDRQAGEDAPDRDREREFEL